MTPFWPRVHWDRGALLPDAGLWLDPHVVRDLALVSHAHTDHVRRHRRAILTSETVALIPPGARPLACEAVEPGMARALPGALLTLHPSGHMLGAIQARVELAGHRVLYTGDLRLRLPGGGRTEVPAAEVIVLESTYGRPHFRFPEPDQVLEDVERWCRRLLDRRVTPVLVGNALGKAQELLSHLGARGLRFAVDERVMTGCRAYARAGVALADPVRLGGGDLDGRVVVMAPGSARSQLSALGRYRSAFVSGWALEPAFWRRLGVDTAFPLSDHCDFVDLIQVARLSAAQHVYTVHGFCEELARQLRRRGVRAHPLAADEQLQLALGDA